MPGKDGYQVARELQRADGPRPFLVAITGYVTAQDVEEARKAGFDLHLKKPAAAADIDNAVQAAKQRIAQA